MKGENLRQAQQAPDLWELFGPRASHDTLRLLWLAVCTGCTVHSCVSSPFRSRPCPLLADTLPPAKSPRTATAEGAARWDSWWEGSPRGGYK